MSFDKKTFEKDFNNFNQDFQDAHVPSPSPPPPPQVPQQEMPYRLPTVQPESVFLSYLPPRRIWIPTPLFVLFFMVFFFESSVLFVYTVVGLFNNLPPTRISMSASDSCNCVPLSEHANSVFNTPVVYVTSNQPAPVTVVSTIEPITITVTASNSVTPPSTIDVVSSASVTAAISAILGGIPHDSASIHIVTAPAPTVTIFSTPPSLPSITTETVLSTAEPFRPTVTSIAFVTGS